MNNEKTLSKIQQYKEAKIKFFNDLCEKLSLNPETVLSEGLDPYQYVEDVNYNLYVLVSKNIAIIENL